MSHTYSKLYIHLVFTTKNREPRIDIKFEEQLKAYIFQHAANHNIKVLKVGGVEDHLHILVSIPPKMSVSDATRLIKGSSSKWLNDHHFDGEKFRWQRGYGAFSISQSVVPAAIQYIKNQRTHHKKRSYWDEFTAFLDKYEIDYDEEQLFR